MPILGGLPADNCRIATGRYTGDGTLSQAITGVGFQPIETEVGIYTVAEQTTVKNTYMKNDQMSGDISIAQGYGDFDNRLISLDSDGFTVDDDGIDEHPNKLNQVYWYRCLG